MSRFSRALIVTVVLLLLGAAPGSCQSFDGAFTGQSDDGPTQFDLHQSGTQVTGILAIGKYRMTLAAKVEGDRALGLADVTGAPVRFAVGMAFEGASLQCTMAVMGADGKIDVESRMLLMLTRSNGGEGSPTASGGSPGAARSGSATLDARTLAMLAGRVKSNFQHQSAETVLADGSPPLTMGSLTAFAELMRLTFDVEMTEAEFDITRRQFVAYYQPGDADTRRMLAQGWQSIVAQIQSASGAERERAIREVHDVFADRFARGARAGMPWAVAMQATIDRRHKNVAQVEAPMPAYAKQAHFNREMTEADLDASLEMLYFMWVACGRDSSLVTMESVVYVRSAIVSNFSSFPADVQLIFANAQQVYSQVRGQWAQATPNQRLQMAYSFSASLDALGLTLPSPNRARRGAWSNVSSQSHGAWAASMVQGLAGSSYKSSW